MSAQDRHQLFIAEYKRDGNGGRAAIAAGFSPRSASTTASRLLALPEIRAEIDRWQAQISAEAKVSLRSLLDEAEGARAVAEEDGNGAAMVAAVLLKARLTGYLDAGKAEVDQTADADRAQAAELKTAGRLLAAAAQSLGLPASASPSQIVGAVALRAIAPPEAFKLLRAARVSTDD